MNACRLGFVNFPVRVSFRQSSDYTERPSRSDACTCWYSEHDQSSGWAHVHPTVLKSFHSREFTGEMDVGEGLPAVVADDQTGVRFLDGPRRREAASSHRRCRFCLNFRAMCVTSETARTAKDATMRTTARTFHIMPSLKLLWRLGARCISQIPSQFRSSSASRVTAGAAGFLTFSQ